MSTVSEAEVKLMVASALSNEEGDPALLTAKFEENKDEIVEAENEIKKKYESSNEKA